MPPMKAKQTKDVRLNLRMTTKLYKALKQSAERSGMNVSCLVRVGIVLAIEQYGIWQEKLINGTEYESSSNKSSSD